MMMAKKAADWLKNESHAAKRRSDNNMGFDPARHQRRVIRLQGYDYSQAGAYFVTVCTQNRTPLFGDVVDGDLLLNDAGRMVTAEWLALPARFPTIELDAFVVMPNHLHGIIVTTTIPVGAALVAAPMPSIKTTPSLGSIVGAFKSRATVEYILGVKTHAWPAFHGRLWQRNYYEHVIRNDESLDRIRQYIYDNPARWAHDPDNPHTTAPDPVDEWAR